MGAVNRITASVGHRVRRENRVDQALYAITMGAAYTLALDGEVGSIEVGKSADFAVLEDDPTDIGAANGVKDVRVWGTVQGGRIFAKADL